MGLFLGHHKLDEISDNFRRFHLYIHEKDQFWPRELDFASHITVKKNQYKVLKFSLVEHKGVRMKDKISH